MTNSVQLFITELIRAANQVEKLNKRERGALLRRAAGAIGEYREQINFPGSQANDRGQGDIVHTLNVMSETVDFVMPEQIAASLMEAVETLKAGRLLLDAKIEREA